MMIWLKSLNQKLRSIVKKFFAEVLLDDLARGKIELKTLPKNMRNFVIACMVLMCLVLVATIILYSCDTSLPGIRFSFQDATLSISYLGLAISIISFIFGWTLLLMGGIRSNAVIYVILSFYFIFFIGYLGIAGAKGWWILFPLTVVFILLVFSLKHSLQVLQKKERIMRNIVSLAICFIISFLAVLGTPVKFHISCIYWYLCIGALTFILMFLALWTAYLWKEQIQEQRFAATGGLVISAITILFLSILIKQKFDLIHFTGELFTVFHYILSYISIFWFILGFSALWGVVNLAEWGRDVLEILFRKKTIFIIVGIFWAGIIALNIYPAGLPGKWAYSLMWTALSVAIAVFLFARKPTVPRILTLFQLTMFVLLFCYTYYVVMEETETVGEMPFRWFSLAIFIIGITWLLFQGTGVIINSTSLRFPRQARLFLFFGLIFIMTGINNAMLITKLQLFINEVKLSSLQGFLYTGPPFVLYLWLVKRLKRYPVRAGQLVALFIWGAILVHPAIVIERVLFLNKIPIFIMLPILAIFQEYIKLWVIRRLVYRSPQFNEYIDGIIYASCIGLGWIIFALNPQFGVMPVPISFLRGIVYTIPAPPLLWYIFTTQFACAGLLGYGLARTKLTGVPYKRANLLLSKPLLLGWALAVVYRCIADMAFNLYPYYVLGWILAVFSLAIVFIMVRKTSNIR